jgi:hypothetical protein
MHRRFGYFHTFHEKAIQGIGKRRCIVALQGAYLLCSLMNSRDRVITSSLIPMCPMSG